jgi:hypothetical protein
MLTAHLVWPSQVAAPRSRPTSSRLPSSPPLARGPHRVTALRSRPTLAAAVPSPPCVVASAIGQHTEAGFDCFFLESTSPPRSRLSLRVTTQRHCSALAANVASTPYFAAPRSRPASPRNPASRPHTGGPRRVAALRHRPTLVAAVASSPSVVASAVAYHKGAGFRLLLPLPRVHVAAPRLLPTSCRRPASLLHAHSPRRVAFALRCPTLAAHVTSPFHVAAPCSRPTSRRRSAFPPLACRLHRVATLRRGEHDEPS